MNNNDEPKDIRQLFKSLSGEEKEKFILQQMEKATSVTAMLESLSNSRNQGTPPFENINDHKKEQAQHFEHLIASLHGLHSAIESSADIDGSVKQQSASLISLVDRLAQVVRDTNKQNPITCRPR